MTISPPTDHGSEQDDKLPALEEDAPIHTSGDFLRFDASTNHVQSPPPRLAARFYRPSFNRRRSSAASSRRNSLASSQSHQSARSYRNACQSNHVAQYLRRASILEGRRARLAAREAHAEQVRLRAALAKAAPRVSNSEERALAAQQARERLLAKVAAACAEEVARAKKVAEENRERRAAEERRCRLEIEEKHAEAERRRLEYRRGRKVRSTSFAAGDGKKTPSSALIALDVKTASERIQRAWRLMQRRKGLAQFVQLNLSIEHIRGASFDDASAMLADPQVIASTGLFLHTLNLVPSVKSNTLAVRTFLSAFMILGHPNDIFSKNGEQEQDLMSKAKEVLICFEALLPKLQSSNTCTAPATDHETLSQAYSAYVTAFAAWRSQDASVLIETMIDQFVALDDIWQTVKDARRGEVANDYREGIRNQQILLLSKIKKLTGPDRANFLIKKAIREARRQRAQRRPVGDVRPRQASSPEASGVNDPAETITVSTEVAGEEARSQDFEVTELSRVFSIVPPNRVLVHELVMDPGYRIEVEPQSDFRNALNRSVCDSMREGVRQGHDDLWTVAMAENIRKRLLKLLKPGNSMHRILSEVLDPTHVQNQCRQNLFSYEKFFHFMADLLPRLCAPIRDAEVQTLTQTLKAPGEAVDALIEKLFGLLHMIDLMSLDYTNYMLQQSAPTLIAEAAGYEQRMFAQDLDSNGISLQRTKHWWRNASVNILTEAHHQEPHSRPTFGRIYTRGLTDLAVAIRPLEDNDLPETLHLDKGRLSRIRTDLLRLVATGAILTTAKNLLKRDVRSQWKPEAKRIYDALSTSETGYEDPDGTLSGRIVSIVESTHGMPQSSRDHLHSLATRFLTEAHAGHLANPVLKLLYQRLKTHVFARLAATSSADRVRVASTATEGLARIGLSEFVGQVGQIVDELGKIARVDLAAHGVWYEQVAREVDGPAEGETQDRSQDQSQPQGQRQADSNVPQQQV